MRSSKAPPNQKNRGQVYPTPPNLASEPNKCNTRWGYLGTSIAEDDGSSIIVGIGNRESSGHMLHIGGFSDSSSTCGLSVVGCCQACID